MVVFDDYLKMTGKPTEPDDVTKNPYTWRHGQDGKSVWEIMAQYPERIQTFQEGLAEQETDLPTVGYYDFSKLKTDEEGRMELVDVGGGQGQCLKQILQAHPDLSPSKVVLQDTPDVINIAKASGTLPDAVVKMEHDFYAEQPVKGISILLFFFPFRPFVKLQ
jgi:O-methyltransferase domain